MTHFKNFKTSLSANGYSHHWKLIKSTQLPLIPHETHSIDFSEKVACQIKKPSYQHIDLVLPSRARNQNERNQLDQFLQIIGTRLPKNSILKTNKKSSPTVDIDNFERNDDKRAFRIQEFIKTEKSYIKTLNALIKYVVNPLKSVIHRKDCILNAFKCTKIFLNVDQIVAANRKFLEDLLCEDNFGATCQKHMKNFECYRKYLLEQGEAQKLHTKEYKSNPVYKRFLSKAREHPDFKKRSLEDILVEPVQRISRYSMMLRDILHLTPDDHPDYQGLKSACEKSRTIATLDDDDPTKAATTLLSLYQAIRDSPCSLINQNRSFVAHLDALEIHSATNKPTRAVTLFLFTDKILVASRASLDSKEVDIDELLDTNTPNLYSKMASKKESALRFRGWADIEAIELFDGIPGPRLFSFLPPKDDLTSHQINDHLQKWLGFKSLYQKTAALVREYEPSVLTFHRLWNDVPTFCSIYDEETYTRVKYKSNCTLVYADTELSIEKLFQNSTFTPWTIGLVHPEDMKGFRFNLSTKIGCTDPYRDRTEGSEQTLDFESIFWNNLQFLDHYLRVSHQYIHDTTLLAQQALSHSLSRSKPITRATSIPTLGKLFSGSEDLRISSSYDKKFMSHTKFLPSLKHQYSDTTKRLPVHSWNGVPSEHLSPEKEFTCDDLLLNVIQERNKHLSYTEEDQEKKNDTISSRGSSSSMASSFSMIDDDDPEESESNIDIHEYLPIAKIDVKKSYQSLDGVLKSIQDFEGEMQQEWKQLISKYELLCGTDMVI